MIESKNASTVAGLEKFAGQGVSTVSGVSTSDSGAAALTLVSQHLHDSLRGYDMGRRQSADRFLRIEFTELASKRAAMAEELDAILSQQRIVPQTGGSNLGGVHRIVLDLQGKLFGRGRAGILREVVRGEGVLEEAYADALAEDLSLDARALLKRHFRQVRATGDRYAAMLDEGEAETVAAPTLFTRIDRLTKPITSNPILSAVVVTAVSALTARLLRPRL
jgi:uncharacterized protein (TIGR02284 family)